MPCMVQFLHSLTLKNAVVQALSIIKGADTFSNEHYNRICCEYKQSVRSHNCGFFIFRSTSKTYSQCRTSR